jgi:hypothetical protein
MLLFLTQLPHSQASASLQQHQQQENQQQQLHGTIGREGGTDDMAVDAEETSMQGLGVPALSSVCTSLLQVIQSPPGLAYLLSTAGDHAVQLRLLQSRLERLAGLILATLTHHRGEFAAALLEVPGTTTGSAPAAMAQLLVALVQPSTWQPVVSVSSSAVGVPASSLAQQCALKVVNNLALGEQSASRSYSSRERVGKSAQASALFRCLAQLCLAAVPHRSRRASDVSEGSTTGAAQRWLQQTQQGTGNGIIAAGGQAPPQQQVLQLELLLSGMLSPLLGGPSHTTLLQSLGPEQVWLTSRGYPAQLRIYPWLSSQLATTGSSAQKLVAAMHAVSPS